MTRPIVTAPCSPSQAAGCAVVEYRLHCEDLARFGWSKRGDEKAKRLAAAVEALGGWKPRKEVA